MSGGITYIGKIVAVQGVIAIGIVAEGHTALLQRIDHLFIFAITHIFVQLLRLLKRYYQKDIRWLNVEICTELLRERQDFFW